MTVDPTDARLLNAIQQQIPLVQRPFQSLAASLDLDESELLARLMELKTGPRRVIRQISAIFDSKRLGYESCLVAARYNEEALDAAAAEINRHPGVSHNYRRNDIYNLWYTLAVPPDSRLGLEKTVQSLHQRSGASATRLMPALKLYKIGVKFNLAGEEEAAARTDALADAAAPRNAVPLGASDRQMIRVLQQDLPLQPRPFDLWAEQAGVTLDQLLAAAERFRNTGIMRRFSAVLRHRQAGFSANAMGVWDVPPEQQDHFGEIAATFAAVSHCYLRPSYPDWPYSLYTMVHGSSADQCEQVLRAIAQATGISHYKGVYSTHEYKKTRVQYFTGDVQRWEEEASAMR